LSLVEVVVDQVILVHVVMEQEVVEVEQVVIDVFKLMFVEQQHTQSQ
jgi:hypothetical protein